MPADFVEQFKPIPVRRHDGLFGRLLNAIRLTVDLQLLTCTRFLKPRLARTSGALLDVGCGEMPFRSLLPTSVRYTGIDVPEAMSFGMDEHDDIVTFDGANIPFPDASHDAVLCTEVLEHAVDPLKLIQEMYRVLRPGGVCLVTVPFAARVHHAPYDFHRFTRFRLAAMFSAFNDVEIIERGNDITVIANKLIVLCARLLQPKQGWALLYNGVFALLLAPFAVFALACAHLSLVFGWGSKNDPLGYAVTARKA